MKQRKISVKDKVLLATASLTEGIAPGVPKPPVARSASLTGPGTMVAHLASESRAIADNIALRAQLEEFEGMVPGKLLDPDLASRSGLSNRHADTFTGPTFEAFKAELRATGGNLVPGKVRPIPGTTPQRYEVVWGQRRHQACLEEGLPFLAVIESLTDKAAFIEADRENRAREDLTPYEQGMSYVKALDAGLYPSIRALAEDVDVSLSTASLAVRLARLPEYILDAFPSRLCLQYRWGPELEEAEKSSPESIREMAEMFASLKTTGKAATAATVLARLTQKSSQPQTQTIEVNGKPAAVVATKGGKHIITFQKYALDEDKLARLKKAIQKILG